MKAANHSAAARRSSISSAASPRSCFLAFSRHAGHTLTHVSRACRVGSRPRLQVCAARLDDPNSNRLTSIAKKISDTDIDGIFEATDRAATTAQNLKIEAASNKLLGFNQSVLTQATAANGTRRTISNVVTAINYQLDANGNLTSDGLRTFEYNAENRLSKVEITKDGEAAKITYLHNAAGQRVFKSEPQTAQTLPNEQVLGTTFTDWLKKNFQWLYATAQTNATLGTSYTSCDGSIPAWAMLSETANGAANSSGRVEYIWLPTDEGNAIPIAMYKGSRYQNIHTDHLGTPRIVTDDAGKPLWQWAYSAFGDNKPTGILKATTNPNSAITNQPVLLVATNPATVLSLRYPGQYWDSETGLAYNHFRNYDPKGGRYTQNDPIGLDGGWNRFGYSNQNPINYYDPTGHVALPALASGLAIGGALVLMTPTGQDAAKGAANGAADEVEKHMSWLANKYKCIMPPKPPGMSLCEYWKSKKPKLKACIESKQSWDDRWEPGRHNLDIKQMLAELANIEQKMERLCKEKDCP